MFVCICVYVCLSIYIYMYIYYMYIYWVLPLTWDCLSLSIGGRGRRGGRGAARRAACALAPTPRRARLLPPSQSFHLGVEFRADLKSIFHRCHLCEVAFVWGLTKEAIHLPLSCLQGGWAHQFYWPRLFFAPKLTNMYWKLSLSTWE